MTVPFRLSRRGLFFSGLLVLILCMMVNCWHTHLWGPDEPREAEIAREIFETGSYVVPRFSGLPFVEKPPLYYDVSAWIFSFSPHPGSLRMHSALLGCLMLAALYVFAAKKSGQPVALWSCALCISMPQFYRAAHWILLDIGVGAWVTAGLVSYGLWSLREEGKAANLPAALFFLFAALGMLTKGAIAVVYLGVITVPHWFFFRRKKLPPLWTGLFFLVPVGIWVYFFYREGGIYFLHEHFINNIFGRLLHRSFRLAGSPVMISDVGHNSPLFFYFKRLPNMFGAAIALFPFAIAWAWRSLGWKFFHFPFHGKVQYVWDLLTRPRPEGVMRKELLVYLMLWSFVPFFVLSIPAIKEVTYLLPSYAGIALLLSCYLADRFVLREAPEELPWGEGFVFPLSGFALAVQVLPKFSLWFFFAFCGLICLGLVYIFVRNLACRNFRGAVLPVLAGLIAGVMLGNTPELMERSRLDRKCYCLFAETVWKEVGSRPLYLKAMEESIRGALPFFGCRDIRVLVSEESLQKLLAGKGEHAILLYRREYMRRLRDPKFAAQVRRYRIIFPDFPEKADSFVLLISEKRPAVSAALHSVR